MNIALVTYALEVGGVETMLHALATGLQSQGHAVTFVETETKGSWSDHFRAQGWDVITVAQQAWRSRLVHAQRIAQVLADSDAVILHDAPFAQSILGLLPENIVALSVLHNALPSMINNASGNPGQFDTLVGVSPAMCQAAIEFGTVGASLVHCIPNGVAVPDAWPKTNATFESCEKTTANKLRVVYVGRIDHEQKGVRHLPAIMRRVKQLGVNAHLDVIGDGPDLADLRDLARTPASHAIDVTFHGAMEHDQAMARLQSADALLMPSYFEGFGLVAAEAMARGVVPVVSKLPACTDYFVTQELDGYLIEPGNENAFATALVQLGVEPNKRRLMSHAAWHTAQKRLSAQTMSNHYLELIQEIQNTKTNTPTLRSGLIDRDLLGDFPRLPLIAVRPWRKFNRLRGAA